MKMMMVLTNQHIKFKGGIIMDVEEERATIERLKDKIEQAQGYHDNNWQSWLKSKDYSNDTVFKNVMSYIEVVLGVTDKNDCKTILKNIKFIDTDSTIAESLKQEKNLTDKALEFLQKHWMKLVIALGIAVGGGLLIKYKGQDIIDNFIYSALDNVDDENEDDNEYTYTDTRSNTTDETDKEVKEKKKREYAGFNVTNMRLSKYDKEILDGIRSREDELVGREETIRNSYTGFSSDGKYMHYLETTYIFDETLCIVSNQNSSYDDERKDSSSTGVLSTRGMLNLYKGKSSLFDETDELD